jgi:hypothetical protein
MEKEKHVIACHVSGEYIYSVDLYRFGVRSTWHNDEIWQTAHMLLRFLGFPGCTCWTLK